MPARVYSGLVFNGLRAVQVKTKNSGTLLCQELLIIETLLEFTKSPQEVAFVGCRIFSKEVFYDWMQA